MSSCNNLNQNCTGNNIYVSGAETRTVIEVSNNKSRYYAELAETYKNKAKEYCDSARYYAEQNSDVSMNYVNNLEAALRNLINSKQDAGEYALTSAIPTKTSDLTNDSNFATTSQIPADTSDLTNGAGYITGITSSDVTTALTYTPADMNLSNISSAGQKIIDGQWVKSYFVIASSVSLKSSDGWVDYSLSTYLPDDNYKYEVIISAHGVGTSTSSGAYLFLKTDIIGGTVESGTSYDAAHIFRGKGTNDASGVATLPVGSGRVISALCSNTSNATINIYVLGYRRIGTNT